jgi:CDP-diacylglycerol pyrophosphatase
VLKDIHGVLQYLLIPTARVSGIESPLLLQADAPDYWAAAWQARQLDGAAAWQPAAARGGGADGELAMGPQPEPAAHSCLRPARLPARLQQAGIGPQWQPLAAASTAMPIWRVQ